MQESLVVRRETHIPAPPAAVFALLTDPEKILRWMGTEAEVEPQPGGLYLVNVTGARCARGSYPRGGAGAPPGLQLWLGRQRGGAAGV
ncbi:Activator of Hsp90 ATPase homolog 1-like protein [Mesorhizobium muleiense]|uniref:Activator of Hsp90 ATPase homolog 1-like protein n=1 Tax=Mesorhizobium muleiense TaxID=1004279 RepID=A0A1G8INP8_9HYPH|nr:Activator of Hsp90 ATPase homolog 1-like protein [Mesorhizobium muleiense]